MFNGVLLGAHKSKLFFKEITTILNLICNTYFLFLLSTETNKVVSRLNVFFSCSKIRPIFVGGPHQSQHTTVNIIVLKNYLTGKRDGGLRTRMLGGPIKAKIEDAEVMKIRIWIIFYLKPATCYFLLTKIICSSRKRYRKIGFGESYKIYYPHFKIIYIVSFSCINSCSCPI